MIINTFIIFSFSHSRILGIKVNIPLHISLENKLVNNSRNMESSIKSAKNSLINNHTLCMYTKREAADIEEGTSLFAYE